MSEFPSTPERYARLKCLESQRQGQIRVSLVDRLTGDVLYSCIGPIEDESRLILKCLCIRQERRLTDWTLDIRELPEIEA